MQLLQQRMPNEYLIHVICLFILPTETVWPRYGINDFRKSCLTLTCMIYLIYPIRLPIVIGEAEMVFNDTENYKFSHKHNIVNFIFTQLVVDH